MKPGLCVYCSQKLFDHEQDDCPVCKEPKSIDLKYCLPCANVIRKCANCVSDIVQITGPDIFSAGC